MSALASYRRREISIEAVNPARRSDFRVNVPGASQGSGKVIAVEAARLK